jgi:hypothetical protein
VFAVMVLLLGFAAFAGLAMSYRNGKAPRQAGSKAKTVHKVMPWRLWRKVLPLPSRFEKYYCLSHGRGL